LLLAMKAEIDEHHRPGRFLLTGSANVLMLPEVADALPGRMEIVELWPLSQGEIDDQPPD
jgi:predicted AAA+ superfamily ATPase